MRPSTDPHALRETLRKFKSIFDLVEFFHYFFILNYLRFTML